MKEQKISAFVLAAGFGTRLRPLTEVVPKPLVPIVGVPMLSWALALLSKNGFQRAIVNAHYLAEQIEPFEGLHEGIVVEVSVEDPDILGTGGGLKYVENRLSDRFVVVNADILCDIDLKSLMESVPEKGAAMSLRRSEDVEKYGVVAADSTGVVVQLAKVAKAAPIGAVDENTHFTGVHALSRSTLEGVPSEYACIVRTAYKDLVPSRVVVGKIHSGVWLDVGDPSAYLDANMKVLSGKGPKHLNPMQQAGWSLDHNGTELGDTSLIQASEMTGPCFVGTGAEIGAGCKIERSVIGSNALVACDSVLEDCVVWDGATVPAGTYRRTIFYSGTSLLVV